MPRLALKRAPILVQVGQCYTPIFEKFQEEYDAFQCAIAKPMDVFDGCQHFFVRLCDEVREYLVLINANEQTVSCGCQKFEMVGFLYSHALKVLDTVNIKKIPNHYIIWR